MDTTHRRRLSLCCCALIAAWAELVEPGNAHAGTAGREKQRQITPIYMLPVALAANTAYIIQTQQLSGGADTVLHVQDRYSGTYIDGNDDCGTRLPGCGGLRSYVDIAAAPQARDAWVIVRSYGQYYSEATLSISPGTQYNMSFTGGF